MLDRPILLTGGTGQVGAALCHPLADLGRVIAPDRQSLDLADLAEVEQVVRSINPGLIVNAAAYTAVDRAESEPDTADLVNQRAVGTLARAGAQCGASMIHYSTDYVFDGRSDTPYRPDDPTRPLSVYGRTKRDGERALLASGIDGVVLRTSWVYSTRGRNFLLTMLRLARERDELRIVDDQVGAPSWADWIAHSTALMLHARVKANASRPFAGISGIYHLTPSGQTTWCGFARAIVERAGLNQATTIIPITTCEYPTPAERPRYSVLDCSTTDQTFGIVRPTWEALLDQAMQVLNQNGESKAAS
jgi:dTDP-4-dehydrorhamnose reductase